MDDWDILLDTGEEKNKWDEEWFCPSCEFGPIAEDKGKCDRCGCKKDQKFREDGLELDDDGWGEEKETVEEIY